MMQTQTIDEPMAKLLAHGMVQMWVALAEVTGTDGIQTYRAMSVQR